MVLEQVCWEKSACVRSLTNSRSHLASYIWAELPLSTMCVLLTKMRLLNKVTGQKLGDVINWNFASLGFKKKPKPQLATVLEEMQGRGGSNRTTCSDVEGPGIANILLRWQYYYNVFLCIYYRYILHIYFCAHMWVQYIKIIDCGNTQKNLNSSRVTNFIAFFGFCLK